MSYLEKILGIQNHPDQQNNNTSGKGSRQPDDIFSKLSLKGLIQKEASKQSDKLIKDNFVFKSENFSNQKIAPLIESAAAKRQRLEEKASELTDNWYGMKQKQTLTEEQKNQLVLLKLRNYISPKSFYKSTDFKKLPQYFQVGTVIEGSDNFKMTKISRKKSKQNLVDQFLEDDQEENFSRRKFSEIQKQQQKIFQNTKLTKLQRMSKLLKQHKK